MSEAATPGSIASVQSVVRHPRNASVESIPETPGPSLLHRQPVTLHGILKNSGSQHTQEASELPTIEEHPAAPHTTPTNQSDPPDVQEQPNAPHGILKNPLRRRSSPPSGATPPWTPERSREANRTASADRGHTPPNETLSPATTIQYPKGSELVMKPTLADKAKGLIVRTFGLITREDDLRNWGRRRMHGNFRRRTLHPITQAEAEAERQAQRTLQRSIREDYEHRRSIEDIEYLRSIGGDYENDWRSITATAGREPASDEPRRSKRRNYYEGRAEAEIPLHVPYEIVRTARDRKERDMSRERKRKIRVQQVVEEIAREQSRARRRARRRGVSYSSYGGGGYTSSLYSGGSGGGYSYGGGSGARTAAMSFGLM